jgi:tetratricopeptide (TPR) repeat protein
MSSAPTRPGISTEDSRLLQFLGSFGEGIGENIQDAYEADLDAQIKTFATLLSVKISEAKAGSIIDIGCGRGIVLKRLSNLHAFTQNSNWIYVAIDDATLLSEIQKLALDLGLNRRLEPITLSNFYSRWPTSEQAPGPNFIICRNVLHELNIEATSILLSHVAANMRIGDNFLIQDFQVFPHSEHRKACWDAESLLSCCIELGLECVLTTEPSRSGNRWFNLLIQRKEEKPGPSADASATVYKWRASQWKRWRELGILANDDVSLRGARIAKLDFELQFAALTFELQSYKPNAEFALDAGQEKRVLHKSFSRVVQQFLAKNEIKPRPLEESVVHFRGFGPALNILEEFLRSRDSVASIIGGRGAGKSTLARHLLCTRAHHRIPVILSMSDAPNAWHIIEQLLSSVGLHIPIGLLAGLHEISLKDVGPDLRGFLNAYAKQLLIYVDDLDKAYDSNLRCMDSELEDLLALISGTPAIKIIFGYRPVAISSSFLKDATTVQSYVARVGRFTDDESIINILDDFVDRARLGLGDYPQRLLEAIDRHPSLAELAGRHIRKSGFVNLDEKFLGMLEARMRAHLWERLIDNESKPAIGVFSELRIATPHLFIDGFSSTQSVNAAIDSGLLYETPDVRWRHLVDGVNVLRRRRISAEDGSEVDSDGDAYPDRAQEQNAARHLAFASAYERLYREDDDPKWLREAYFHTMFSKDPAGLAQFGRFMRSELVLAADFWFRKKKYGEALKLYAVAIGYGLKSETTFMRMAACRMRSGDAGGEAEYLSLISQYPRSKGIKSSYIDSLLALKMFERAITQLGWLSIRPPDGAWAAGQYGRAFMGLHRYADAVEVIKMQISLTPLPEPIVFQNLARAYQHQGRTEEEANTLTQALKSFPGNESLLISLAAHLERIRAPEAENMLVDLIERHPGEEALAFSRIKLLCRTARIAIARDVLKQCKQAGGSGPILISAEAEIATRSGREREAIKLLSSRPSNDEAAVGMTLEAFVSLATRQSDHIKRIEIALEGLNYTYDHMLNKNGPIIISRGKLAKLAEDKSLFSELLECARAIGTSEREITRLIELSV